MDAVFNVMSAHGWEIDAPRDDGSRRATRSTVALGAGYEMKFEVVAPALGDWTLTVTQFALGRCPWVVGIGVPPRHGVDTGNSMRLHGHWEDVTIFAVLVANLTRVM